MRARALLLLTILGGCFYRRAVPADHLGAMHRPGQREALVVRGETVWRARLGAQSSVRFRSADGAWSDWVPGHELYVDADGVYMNGHVELPLHARTAEVTGLAPGEAEALERTRPEGGALEQRDLKWVVSAEPEVLKAWIDAFITEVARLHDKRVPIFLCGPERTPAPDCAITDYDAMARERLRWKLGGQPLGRWRFDLEGQGWTRPLAAESLYKSLVAYPTRVGYHWDQIDGAEVEALSGGRTLAAVIATTAFVGLTGKSVTIDGPTHQPGTWAPDVADTNALEAEHLFSRRERRRAMVRLVVAADALATFPRPDRELEGVTVAARLAESFEIGMSVRRFAGRVLEEPAQWDAAAVWSFYMGGNFAIGAPHRWAIPFGFDAGGGHDVGYFRLRWGLRYRFYGDWFVGVYPVNPTYTGVPDPADKRPTLPGWSFPSGVEIGVAL